MRHMENTPTRDRHVHGHVHVHAEPYGMLYLVRIGLACLSAVGDGPSCVVGLGTTCC